MRFTVTVPSNVTFPVTFTNDNVISEEETVTKEAATLRLALWATKVVGSSLVFNPCHNKLAPEAKWKSP